MKNACVVGYGAIGPIHVSAIEKCEYANLYAICDNDQKKLELAKKNCNCNVFSDFNEMLTDSQIDVVHICTPHYLHKDMAVAALKSGKDIVLEKPLTMNKDELKELCDLKTDKKICAMLQNRTNKSIITLKNIIENDQSIGKMLGISAFLTWQRTPEYYNADEWRGKWKTEGGGLLINQAVHTLDLVDWLGGGIKAVKASISTKKLSDVIEVEDTADALFEMNNGSGGLFYAANTYSQSTPPRVEINFENAAFRYADERLYKITKDSTQVIDEDNNIPEGKQYWGCGHKKVINDFYKSLSAGKGEYITLDDAVHVMKVLFAFYESGKNNSKKITID